MKKEFFGATWTLIGITLGAGIFGLPYVFAKAGFFTGLIVLLLAFAIMTIITLYLGEVCIRTKEKHQLTGLAAKYLGAKGKWLMFAMNVITISLALSAYIIGAGAALQSIFGGNNLLFSIIFFILLAPVIYFGIGILEGFESIFNPLKVLIVLILSGVLVYFIDFSNLTGFSFSNLLVPYGVAIFAFAGTSAIPEMNEELKNKKYMFGAILLGMVISLVVNFIFAFSVVGSLGSVGEVATVSLSQFGTFSNIFTNLFAFLAMATAFVTLGFALKETYLLDLKIKNFKAWILTIIIPLVIVLSGWIGFIKLLELVGALGMGIILILIMMMHSKAKKLGNRKPEYSLANNLFLKFVLGLILIVGIVYSLGVF